MVLLTRETAPTLLAADDGRLTATEMRNLICHWASADGRLHHLTILGCREAALSSLLSVADIVPSKDKYAPSSNARMLNVTPTENMKSSMLRRSQSILISHSALVASLRQRALPLGENRLGKEARRSGLKEEQKYEQKYEQYFTDYGTRLGYFGQLAKGIGRRRTATLVVVDWFGCSVLNRVRMVVSTGLSQTPSLGSSPGFSATLTYVTTAGQEGVSTERTHDLR